MSQTEKAFAQAAETVAENAVSVRNVSKNYGDVEALKNLSLEFPRGQLTSLLGPSGCGKTTLLKIIAGLLDPTSGEIEVNGQAVTGPGPDRAFVFQDFALLPWASVIRNVAFGLELRGVAKSEREGIAEKYISDVGLAGFEKSFPHELSGGMRQRVGLARALSVDAQVLLMDEPFSAVDEQTRRKFQEDLLNLVQQREQDLHLRDPLDRRGGLRLGPDRDPAAAAEPRVRDHPPQRLSRTSRSTRSAATAEYLDIVDEIWASLRSYVE